MTTADGMGYAPDVILLQQTECADAQAIAGFIEGKLKLDIGSTAPFADYRVPKCVSNTNVTANEPYKLPGDVRVANDTAILYLAQAIEKIDNGTTVITRFTREQACADPGISVDLDGDGITDCGADRKRTWRRHFILGVKEKQSGLKTAVASLHLQLRRQLDGDEVHELKKTEWTQKAATRLERLYPNADAWVVAGDMNIARCLAHPDEEKEFIDPARCEQRAWWTNLTGSRTYDDAIYTRHGLPYGSQASLTNQYKNGCIDITNGSCSPEKKDFRIDFIFSKAATGLDPAAASHDLTCGENAPTGVTPSCAWLNNSARYSDHRLLWTMVETVVTP